MRNKTAKALRRIAKKNSLKHNIDLKTSYQKVNYIKKPIIGTDLFVVVPEKPIKLSSCFRDIYKNFKFLYKIKKRTNRTTFGII